MKTPIKYSSYILPPLIIFSLMSILICIDAYTKHLSESIISPLMILGDIISLEYVQNRGIAFSLPLTWIALKTVTLILIFWIIYYYLTQEKKKHSLLLDAWYLFIVSGAVWNAWERIFHWYVTDFIAVKYFAVFNMADAYISLGVFLIILYYIYTTPCDQEK